MVYADDPRRGGLKPLLVEHKYMVYVDNSRQGGLWTAAQHDGRLLENYCDLRGGQEVLTFQTNAMGHARGGVHRATQAVFTIRGTV